MAETVNVAVRVRPFLPGEERPDAGGVAVAPNPNYDPEVVPTVHNLSTSSKYAGGMVRVQSGRVTAAGRELDMTSAYDFVFGSDAPQDDVYAVVAPSVNSVVRGINCTVFAYGQTGTGKTFTMLGKDLEDHLLHDGIAAAAKEEARADWGVIPRACRDLFAHLDEPGRSGVVHCSYMQIYNDRLYDLMQDAKRQFPLSIREPFPSGAVGGGGSRFFRQQEIFVQGLSQFRVTSFEDVLRILETGGHNRAVRATEYNEQSSRSHAVLRLTVECEESVNSGTEGDAEEHDEVDGGGDEGSIGGDGDDDDGKQKADEKNNKGKKKKKPTGVIIRRAKLNLVDLAGSEKWNTRARIEGARAKELTNINHSLSALGNVIGALTEKRRSHIPYRDSKLTRLLQDSLGGNCRTTVICTLSPSALSAEESASTLSFANRAMRVLVRIKVNEVVDDTVLLQRAQAEIARLRRKLRNRSGKRYKELIHQVHALREMNLDVRAENQKLKNKVRKLQAKLASSRKGGRRMRGGSGNVGDTVVLDPSFQFPPDYNTYGGNGGPAGGAEAMLASLGDVLRPDQRAQLQRELGAKVLRGGKAGGVGEAALQMAEVNCAETLAAESAHLDAVQEERAALEAQLRLLQEQMGDGVYGDSDSAFGEEGRSIGQEKAKGGEGRGARGDSEDAEKALAGAEAAATELRECMASSSPTPPPRPPPPAAESTVDALASEISAAAADDDEEGGVDEVEEAAMAAHLADLQAREDALNAEILKLEQELGEEADSSCAAEDGGVSDGDDVNAASTGQEGSAPPESISEVDLIPVKLASPANLQNSSSSLHTKAVPQRGTPDGDAKLAAVSSSPSHQSPGTQVAVELRMARGPAVPAGYNPEYDRQFDSLLQQRRDVGDADVQQHRPSPRHKPVAEAEAQLSLPSVGTTGATDRGAVPRQPGGRQHFPSVAGGRVPRLEARSPAQIRAAQRRGGAWGGRRAGKKRGTKKKRKKKANNQTGYLYDDSSPRHDEATSSASILAQIWDENAGTGGGGGEGGTGVLGSPSSFFGDAELNDENAYEEAREKISRRGNGGGGGSAAGGGGGGGGGAGAGAGVGPGRRNRKQRSATRTNGRRNHILEGGGGGSDLLSFDERGSDVGLRVRVYRARIDDWQKATIVDYDPESGMHRLRYDRGGESQWHQMTERRYRVLGYANPGGSSPKGERSSYPVQRRGRAKKKKKVKGRRKAAAVKAAYDLGDGAYSKAVAKHGNVYASKQQRKQQHARPSRAESGGQTVQHHYHHHHHHHTMDSAGAVAGGAAGSEASGSLPPRPKGAFDEMPPKAVGVGEILFPDDSGATEEIAEAAATAAAGEGADTGGLSDSDEDNPLGMLPLMAGAGGSLNGSVLGGAEALENDILGAIKAEGHGYGPN